MNNLKKLRNLHEITMKELAEATTINRSVLSLIENEKRPFTQEHLEILCKYFDVSTDYMLGRTEIKKAPLQDASELDIALYNQFGELTDAQKEDALKAIQIIKGLAKKDE